MKIISKFFILFFSVTMCISNSLLSLATNINENNANDEQVICVANDGFWAIPTEDDFSSINQFKFEKIQNRNSLPSSVDNSSSNYFPPIGNQGELYSCAAWASTYYQFTYEVNKLRNVATDSSNIYSPTWTYNYINGGIDNGSWIHDAYDILRRQGAMKLADFPYSSTIDTYSFDWSTDIQKMTQALQYRISNVIWLTGSSEDEITNIKTGLANGKIAVVWTNPDGWITATSTNNENVIIRGSVYDSGGHYMTVVGYDDDIVVNVNGQNMVGAFKLANSWGTGTWNYGNGGNNGYIWVAYDALNEETELTNNWQANYNLQRMQIFGDNNYFSFIVVSQYKNYLVGKVTYLSNDPWHTNIYLGAGTSANTKKFTPLNKYYSQGGTISNLTNSSYRVIVFDYLDDYFNSNLNMENYLTSQFTTKCMNNTNNITYRIHVSAMDSLCKNIAPNDTVFGSLPSSGGYWCRTLNINLAKGKICDYYSTTLSASDVSLLNSYLHGNTNFSSLQFYLADMNDDNNVNIYDLILLQQALSAQNNETFTMTTYIPNLDCSMAEFIENEFGEDMTEFMAQYAEELAINGIDY